MAKKFSESSVRELLKTFLIIDRALSDKLYIKSKKNPDLLRKLYDDDGSKLLSELEDYMKEFETPVLPGSITIRSVINDEVYRAIPLEEIEEAFAENGLNDLVKDPRIDIGRIKTAYEVTYGSDGCDKAENAVKLKIGGALGEKSNFTRANTNQVLADGYIESLSDNLERTKSKLGKSRRNTVASIVSGVALAAILVSLLAHTYIVGNVKEYNANEAFAKYKDAVGAYNLSEEEELNLFEQFVAAAGVSGFTQTEFDNIKKERDAYAQTDNAEFGFSSTPAMDAIIQDVENQMSANQIISDKDQIIDGLNQEIAQKDQFIVQLQADYDQLEKDYQALQTGSTQNPLDYVNLLYKVTSIIENVETAMADSKLTAGEKTQIMQQLSNMGTYQEKLVQDLSDKFGMSIENVLNSIEMGVVILKNEITDLNNKITDLKVDNNKKDINIATLTKTIDDLNKLVKQLEDQLANTPNVNSQLVAELVAAKQEIIRLNSELTKVIAEKDIVVSENNSLKKEIVDLNSKIVVMQSVVDTFSTENVGLKKEISDLKKTVDSITAERDLSKAEIATLKQVVADLEKKLNDKVSAYEKMYAEFLIVDEAYDKLVEENEKLKVQLEQAIAKGEDVTNLKAQIAENEKIIAKKDAELETAFEKIKDQGKIIAEQATEIAQLKISLSENNLEVMRQLYTQLTGKDSSNMNAETVRGLLESECGITFDFGDSSESNNNADENESGSPQK